MESFARAVLTEKFVNDDRRAVGNVTVPFIEGSFAIYAPKTEFWIHLFLLLFVQIAVLCPFVTAIYRIVIKNRGTPLSLLFGYGVIIPLGILAPIYLSDLLDIQSRGIRLSLMITPTIAVFRCMEAMHGTSPPVVEASFANYMIYYSSLNEVFWDEKTKSRVAATLKEVQTATWRILTQLLMLSVVYSTLLHFNFEPFQSDVRMEILNVNLDFIKPTQLMNNYCNAVMTFLAISLAYNLSAFANTLQGVSYQPIFRNPLFCSQSPSDFWGYRWNMTIHRTLKRAAFEPVRNAGYPVTLAILAAFFASGLLHDFSWYILFRPTVSQRDENGNCEGCWTPTYGKQTAFFMWCGFTMLLERLIGKAPTVRWVSQHFPRPLVSTLVVVTALPFSHWFTGDWITGGYFEHLSIGLFKIIYQP